MEVRVEARGRDQAVAQGLVVPGLLVECRCGGAARMTNRGRPAGLGRGAWSLACRQCLRTRVRFLRRGRYRRLGGGRFVGGRRRRRLGLPGRGRGGFVRMDFRCRSAGRDRCLRWRGRWCWRWCWCWRGRGHGGVGRRRLLGHSQRDRGSRDAGRFGRCRRCCHFPGCRSCRSCRRADCRLGRRVLRVLVPDHGPAEEGSGDRGKGGELAIADQGTPAPLASPVRLLAACRLVSRYRIRADRVQRLRDLFRRPVRRRQGQGGEQLRKGGGGHLSPGSRSRGPRITRTDRSISMQAMLAAGSVYPPWDSSDFAEANICHPTGGELVRDRGERDVEPMISYRIAHPTAHAIDGAISY